MMPTCSYKRCRRVGERKIGVHSDLEHPYLCSRHFNKVLKILNVSDKKPEIKCGDWVYYTNGLAEGNPIELGQVVEESLTGDFPIVRHQDGHRVGHNVKDLTLKKRKGKLNMGKLMHRIFGRNGQEAAA